MSGDTLVYDLSSMTEGTPQVFVKKDWLNILDNQSGNYQGNQSVVDTSQLANSNKYMNYREAYLAVPMVLTATASALGAGATAQMIDPQAVASSFDYTLGLRNWFGSIIHSFTLDYNGTTIIQQTPFCSMWNCFRLMTSLSMNDVITNGADMGFYPDDPLAWGYSTAGNTSGKGTYNNGNFISPSRVSGAMTGYRTGNIGFLQRQMYINFDPTVATASGVVGGLSGGGTGSSTVGDTFATLLTAESTKAQYKSYVSLKTATAFQIAIMATIHLKHIHNFFQNIPLLKGVFMKMTINLNQTQITTTTGVGGTGWASGGNTTTVNSALGGVCPIMIASAGSNTGVVAPTGSLIQQAQGASQSVVFNSVATSSGMNISLAVGNRPIMTSQSTVPPTAFNQSITLYVPAYTFNPTYEDAYLSSPVKTIVYTDIYQYQFNAEGQNGSFNQLITNGIANIKSVLVIPYFRSGTGYEDYPAFQSPFDDAGAGTTSPLVLLNNFNVVVAGANMIYNTQKYSYEQFLHQLRGCGAVNADLTDGLTSGLIDKLGFESKQCFYYVDCSRMLPVEEAVPKSVSIIGTNVSQKAVSFFVFIEYGVQVSVDILTGARV
jgi:hypothetical protein